MTYPGLVNERVTEPVALVRELKGAAEVIAVTPVFMTEKMLDLVWIWMPVEAFRATVPVRLPREATYWVLETR